MEEYKCLGFKPDKILYSVTVMLLFKQNKAEIKSFKCFFFSKVFKRMLWRGCAHLQFHVGKQHQSKRPTAAEKTDEL